MTEFKYEVVCDRGFGHCFSRLAETLEEAERTMAEWKAEKNSHGTFRIQSYPGSMFVTGEYRVSYPDTGWW